MIQASGIHKSFGHVEVLKGVDLTVAAGEIVALVGASGAGKTTLLQILGGGGGARSESMARAMELLDYLGLGPRASHRPSQLSGGEAQRGAVARALVNRPSVVLADEPSGSLDSRNRAELHRLFFDLRRDMGATFLIVTHDENLAADCDRTVRMADGMIEAIHTTSTII